jgi:hypothetical protein
MQGPTSRHREADIVLFPPHAGRHLTPATNHTMQPADRTVDRPINITDAVGRPRTSQLTTRTVWERAVPWLKALGVLIATGTILALVWLAYLAVMALIALVTAVVTWISTHLLLIAIILAGLFFFGGGSAACAGIHCGGCRR